MIKKILLTVLVTVWIVILVMLTSRFVGLAASNHWLLWAAPILPLFPILGLYWLKPKAELAGWAIFTIWLGSTYAMGGDQTELIVFGVIIALAIGGLFKPWLMVVAWFGHIIWDFFPRELPELLLDLPMACMIFDGLIGAYLIWRIRSTKKPLHSLLR